MILFASLIHSWGRGGSKVHDVSATNPSPYHAQIFSLRKQFFHLRPADMQYLE